VGNWSASNVAPPSAADQMRIGARVRPGIPLIRWRLLIPASLALLGALTAMAAGSSGAAAATAPMPSSGVGSITRVLWGSQISSPRYARRARAMAVSGYWPPDNTG
jgi:hypothetical protein